MTTKAAPPLAGVRVLELTTSVAGQTAGMLLADLGADVVRLAGDGDVERTGLPGWLCWNRGKTIVAGGADLDRLLPRADVLLARRPSIGARRGAASTRPRCGSGHRRS